MTILDDLFKEANGLWTAIQGTADHGQRVVVDAAMVEIAISRLDRREHDYPFNILPGDTLIYNPRTPLTPASFVGSELTILAPGLYTRPGHNPADATVVDSPDYGMLLANATSTAATDETGTFVYFPLQHAFVAVIFNNIRLKPV